MTDSSTETEPQPSRLLVQRAADVPERESRGDLRVRQIFQAESAGFESSLAGMGKNTLKAGVAYEYWRNKFGNPTTDVIGPGAGPGATARTPMVRVEYHL